MLACSSDVRILPMPALLIHRSILPPKNFAALSTEERMADISRKLTTEYPTFG